MEEIRKYLNADSLHYLSQEGMVRATGLPKSSFCMACYDGNYPVPYDPKVNKLIIERRNARQPTLADSLAKEKAQIKLL
jgi:amidophosphoribosyltransferase